MSYFEQTKVADSTGVAINPVQEETILLLRRMVKLLESNAVVDAYNRQRVNVENTIGIASGTLNTVGNVAAYGGVDSRFQIIDWARQSYNTGIRERLTFS